MSHPYWNLNDQERERVDHDDMIECSQDTHFTEKQREAYKKAHDRIYGRSSCSLCHEPILEKVQRMFENTP